MDCASSKIGPELLRRWRLSQKPGCTQAHLGRCIGLADGSYIQKYEAGSRPLPIDRLVALSEYTGIPLEALASPEQVPTLRAIAEQMRAEQGRSAEAPPDARVSA